MAPRLRRNVLRMQPYSPGKPIDEVRRELGLDHIVKLASNENPLGPPPKAIKAIQEAAHSLHLYPDAAGFELRKAIAAKLGLADNQIALGNGSDDIIQLLGLVFLGSPEDEIVAGDPSFVRYYATAELGDAKMIRVPLDSRMVHDLNSMAKAVTDKTKLVFIANPNNPTGTIVRKPDMDRFLADLPEQVFVVVDEAYYEFACDAPDYPRALDYLAAGKPVMGLRTFSKTYGLAGIRVGYGFGPAEVVDAINRAREPFNVNSLAQVAAIAALDDEDHLRRTLENNRKQMVRMVQAMEECGAQTYESYTNFVFADLKQPADPIFKALLSRGVIVRAGNALGMPNCVRVSVGTEEETDIFIAAFREVMAAVPA